MVELTCQIRSRHSHRDFSLTGHCSFKFVPNGLISNRNKSALFRKRAEFPWFKELIHTIPHYNYVTMGSMASQITSLTIVNSVVYSGEHQRKHQSSASLACGEITWDRWIPRTNGQWRVKWFHLMTSSCDLFMVWFRWSIWLGPISQSSYCKSCKIHGPFVWQIRIR